MSVLMDSTPTTLPKNVCHAPVDAESALPTLPALAVLSSPLPTMPLPEPVSAPTRLSSQFHQTESDTAPTAAHTAKTVSTSQLAQHVPQVTPKQLTTNVFVLLNTSLIPQENVCLALLVAKSVTPPQAANPASILLSFNPVSAKPTAHLDSLFQAQFVSPAPITACNALLTSSATTVPTTTTPTMAIVTKFVLQELLVIVQLETGNVSHATRLARLV